MTNIRYYIRSRNIYTEKVDTLDWTYDEIEAKQWVQEYFEEDEDHGRLGTYDYYIDAVKEDEEDYSDCDEMCYGDYEHPSI